MLEVGFINGKIAGLLAGLGHGDQIMIADAGFATPRGAEVIDLAWAQNQPKVLELMSELLKYFSVEKIVTARETSDHNPSFYQQLSSLLDRGAEREIIPHVELKKRSEQVKAIIRTGDFTAYGNVLLVSGAGGRWFREK